MKTALITAGYALAFVGMWLLVGLLFAIDVFAGDAGDWRNSQLSRAPLFVAAGVDMAIISAVIWWIT